MVFVSTLLDRLSYVWPKQHALYYKRLFLLVWAQVPVALNWMHDLNDNCCCYCLSAFTGLDSIFFIFPFVYANCSVKTIQLLFAKSLEQVNLDVVFLEEKYHEDKATTHYYNTVAYMLVWKLLTEVMAICQAEVSHIQSCP